MIMLIKLDTIHTYMYIYIYVCVFKIGRQSASPVVRVSVMTMPISASK